MATESDVQLLAEGAGPLIRTVTVTTLVDDTQTDVRMQVVGLADSDGTLINLRDSLVDPVSRQLLTDIRDRLDILIGILG